MGGGGVDPYREVRSTDLSYQGLERCILAVQIDVSEDLPLFSTLATPSSKEKVQSQLAIRELENL